MRALLWIGVFVASACGGGASRVFDGEVVRVACGMCVFPAGLQGCYWAAEVDGTYLPVAGALPDDHESHAPDGMCNTPREAVVDGRIAGDRLIVTRFELLPAREVPEAPAFTPEDLH